MDMGFFCLRESRVAECRRHYKSPAARWREKVGIDPDRRLNCPVITCCTEYRCISCCIIVPVPVSVSVSACLYLSVCIYLYRSAGSEGRQGKGEQTKKPGKRKKGRKGAEWCQRRVYNVIHVCPAIRPDSLGRGTQEPMRGLAGDRGWSGLTGG
jgi:hypothetical protein